MIPGGCRRSLTTSPPVAIHTINKQNQTKMKTVRSLAAFALLAAAVSFATVGCKTQEHTHGSEAAAPAAFNPSTQCVVTGEPLGDKPYTFVHNSQQVKLCCKDCLPKFDKDPENYMAKLAAPK
jgi:hypothetical protein